MSAFEESDPTDVVDAPAPPPEPGEGGDLQVYIDGTDVSSCALTGSVTRRLNRPGQATVKLPMDCAIGGCGSRLKVYFNGNLHHHGFVLNCETDAGEDTGYTVYNSTDPMELWQWRPARDEPTAPDPGDMSKPTFIERLEFAPQIMEGILEASENVALIPSKAEGPLFLDLGGFAGGGVSMLGAPTDWPMSIAEIATLLVSTGELDIIITPTDPGGGTMGTVDCYNGDYGSDLSGSVSFEYATGDLNVRHLRWNEDMSNMVNKLWYYGGPRVGVASDPAGDQHWCWNITADDPGLADPPLADVISCREDSQAAVGVRMEVQIFDGLGDDCVGEGGTDPGRDFYRYLWLAESWARCQCRELIHVTPTRGTAIGAFDIGDLVAVSAGASVRGGFSGAQRVYEYTISWDEDGPFELSELQTSSDVGVGN